MRKTCWMVVFLCLVVVACQANPPDPVNKTLASLRQVDDYPLYEMHYDGDYGFGEYLRKGGGALPTPATVLPKTGVAYACTCFAALAPGGDAIFGRNFDWYDHPALILFTDSPDGYASVSMVDISYLGYTKEISASADKQALLRAPFLPFDGMNEKGLAMGMMAVDYADGGNDPQKMTLEDLEVIRLALDYARDVPQALELLQNYNVHFGEVPIHYLVVDRAGNSAVIEYVGGEMRVLPSEQPWQVSTNFIISEVRPEKGQTPCWRYNQASQALKQAGGRLTPDAAMALLQSVSQTGDFPTRWSVVYNLSTGQEQVVMNREYGKRYEFSLKVESQE
jgi:hypothetical protein